MRLYHLVGDFGHAVVISDTLKNAYNVCKGLGYITYQECLGTSNETNERVVIVNYKTAEH